MAEKGQRIEGLEEVREWESGKRFVCGCGLIGDICGRSLRGEFASLRGGRLRLAQLKEL